MDNLKVQDPNISKNDEVLPDQVMENLQLSHLKFFKKIGKGSYADVYKCQHIETNRILALKRVRKMDKDDNGVPPATLREVACLKELKHPNIVSLESVIIKEHDIFLVFEFLSMDLLAYMKMIPPKENIDRKLIKSYMFQIVTGINFCHSRRILHRDLKPNNLLIDHLGTIKVADFGMALAHHNAKIGYTTQVMSLWYRAPELLLGSSFYSSAVDVWSIGLIFAGLIVKDNFIKGDTPVDQVLQIFRILGTPTEKDWPGITSLPYYPREICPTCPANDLRAHVKEIDEEGYDLLQCMLTCNPEKRKTCKSMLLHPYFFHVDSTVKPVGVKPADE